MTTDKSSEREAFEAWAATVMLNLKRLYAGYFHEATAFAWLAWQARAALSQQAQETSLPPQGAASPDPQLLKFYAVSDYPSLVAAMLRHIEKLQSKLPKDGQPLLTRVRA